MMGSTGLCSRRSLGRHLVPPVRGLDMPGRLQVGPSSPFGWRELFILWGLLGQKYLLPDNVKHQRSLFRGSVAVCFGAAVSLFFSLAWCGGGGAVFPPVRPMSASLSLSAGTVLDTGWGCLCYSMRCNWKGLLLVRLLRNLI